MAEGFLGVDVGSTKTHALVADGEGRALGWGCAGPGNPEAVGYDGLAKVLAGAVEEALEAAGSTVDAIAGAGFGISGYDWPSQRERVMEAVNSLALDAPVGLVNDALLGVLAGAEAGWGVAVVAGTSCNAWGRDPEGRTGRMTGFSWLGEAAGAGELVAKALQAVARQWTYRAPPTRLTETFVQSTGSSTVERLLEGLTLGRLEIGPKAAPLVFRVAESGDPVAQSLIRWAGRELGSLAIGVIRQLDLQPRTFDLVLGGSFFKGSPLLIEEMHQVVQPVAPRARLIQLNVPPVVGGVVLGMEEAGLDPASLRQPLIASTRYLLLAHDASS